MNARRDYIQRIKEKLDEWDDELERLERQAGERSGNPTEEWERHRLELQEMLLEMQERIDELRDQGDRGWSRASAGLEQEWGNVSRDLEVLTDRLYPGN